LIPLRQGLTEAIFAAMLSPRHNDIDFRASFLSEKNFCNYLYRWQYIALLKLLLPHTDPKHIQSMRDRNRAAAPKAWCKTVYLKKIDVSSLLKLFYGAKIKILFKIIIKFEAAKIN